MTDEMKRVLDGVREDVEKAKHGIVEAQDWLASAAERCRGLPMEDRLNSFYDALEDLRFDLRKEVDEFGKRLNGEGNEAPESWKEAV